MKQLILSEEILRQIVHNSMLIIMREKAICSVNLRNEMDISKSQGLEEIGFSELKCIFDRLVETGDPEKLFTMYFLLCTMQQLHYNLQGSTKDFPNIQLHCLQSELLKSC